MNFPDQKTFESKLEDVFEIKFNPSVKTACHIHEITSSQTLAVNKKHNQFSVIFASPSSEVYEQGIYKVSHAELGELALFLVPVYGDEETVHYEAIFT